MDQKQRNGCLNLNSNRKYFDLIIPFKLNHSRLCKLLSKFSGNKLPNFSLYLYDFSDSKVGLEKLVNVIILLMRRVERIEAEK